MQPNQLALLLALCLLPTGLVRADDPPAGKLQVYVLAGQSNMEGHGQVRSLGRLAASEEHAGCLESLRQEDGTWAVRDDVTIVWSAKTPRSGPLGLGWGAAENEVGPELMFGTKMGEFHKEPVLLIKTAWGGKDVFCDFRSPSAGPPTGAAARVLATERERGQAREVGASYRAMLAEIRTTLANLETLVPGYTGGGYELAGMAWFQGWNDYCRWPEEPGVIDEYTAGLVAMFRDLRKDLGAPGLKIAIGEMGVGGLEIEARAKDNDEARAMVAFRNAQRKVAAELEGVTFVPTATFWDARLEELRRMSDAFANEKRERGIADTEDNVLPTKELSAEFRSLGGHWYCHYNGSAANYCRVGHALAEALLH